MPINPEEFPEVPMYLNKIFPFSEGIWSKTARFLEVKIYEKGTYFAKEGRIESQFGIVLDGILRAYINTGKGSEYTKTFFTPIYYKTPISFIGAYSSLVSATVNKVNIQALTQSRILTGNYNDWLHLASENYQVSNWSRKFAELLFVSKEHREFEYITMQAEDRYKLFRNRFPEIEHHISQYYIAQFLGISATQLSRIRKKMFSQG